VSGSSLRERLLSTIFIVSIKSQAVAAIKAGGLRIGLVKVRLLKIYYMLL